MGRSPPSIQEGSEQGVCSGSFTIGKKWQQADAISHWIGYCDVTKPLTVSSHVFSIVCQPSLMKADSMLFVF